MPKKPPAFSAPDDISDLFNEGAAEQELDDEQAGPRALSLLTEDIVALIERYERAEGDARDPALLRGAADLIVQARVDHFQTNEGVPDFAGQGWPYRQWSSEIYGRVTSSPAHRIELGNRLRYHLGQAVRAAVSLHELEDAGLFAATLKDRGRARRERRTALVDLVRPGAAYTAEEALEALEIVRVITGRLTNAETLGVNTLQIRLSLQKLRQDLSVHIARMP